MPAPPRALPRHRVLWPTAITRIIGSASATAMAETGTTSTAMLSSAHRSWVANGWWSPTAASWLSSGRIVRVHRLGEDAVRRHDRHERELVGDDAALDLVADRDRRGEQDPDTSVLEHRPRRELEQPAELGVDPAEARSQPEAGARQRHGRDADEADDPEHAAECQHELLGPVEVERRVRTGEHAEHHERAHDRHGVRDRGQGEGHEPTLREEHRGGHGADRVQQDLEHEEPRQERRESLLVGPEVRGRRRWR